MFSLVRSVTSRRDATDSKPARPRAVGHESDAGGKTDLLMRFFESEWFDAWIALTYLYRSPSPSVQDYLCQRLRTLPEREVEPWLSQLCQLCVQRPGSGLESVLIDLSTRSLRFAVKAYWLLLAISQDNPRDVHVAALRDRCEIAALEGTWDLPFKEFPGSRREGGGRRLPLEGSSSVGRLPLDASGLALAPAGAGAGSRPESGASYPPHDALFPDAARTASGSSAGPGPGSSGGTSSLSGSSPGTSHAGGSSVDRRARARGAWAVDLGPSAGAEPGSLGGSSSSLVGYTGGAALDASAAGLGPDDDDGEGAFSSPTCGLRRLPSVAELEARRVLEASRSLRDGRSRPGSPRGGELAPGAAAAGGAGWGDRGSGEGWSADPSGRSYTPPLELPGSRDSEESRRPDRATGGADPSARGRDARDTPPPCASPDRAERPLSPDGLGAAMFGSVFVDIGVEGLMEYIDRRGEGGGTARRARTWAQRSSPGGEGAAGSPSDPDGPRPVSGSWSPAAGGDDSRCAAACGAAPAGAPWPADAAAARSRRARDGSPLSPPLASSPSSTPQSAARRSPSPPPASPPTSPRARRSTFGATLDFSDALCAASTGLTAFPEEDREWALRTVLGRLDAEVEAAARDGVGVWYPQGEGDLRVVRVAARECRLLNSREKAPFVLVLEVLDEKIEREAAERARARRGADRHHDAGRRSALGRASGSSAARSDATPLPGGTPALALTPAVSNAASHASDLERASISSFGTDGSVIFRAGSAAASAHAPVSASALAGGDFPGAGALAMPTGSVLSASVTCLSDLAAHGGPAIPPVLPPSGTLDALAYGIAGVPGAAHSPADAAVTARAPPRLRLPSSPGVPARSATRNAQAATTASRGASHLTPPSVVSPPAHAHFVGRAPLADERPPSPPTSPAGFGVALRAAAACVVPNSKARRTASGAVLAAASPSPPQLPTAVPEKAPEKQSLLSKVADKYKNERKSKKEAGAAAAATAAAGPSPHAQAGANGYPPPHPPTAHTSRRDTAHAAPPPPEDALNAGLRAAQESLRGAAPLVSVRLIVEDEGGEGAEGASSLGQADVPAEPAPSPTRCRSPSPSCSDAPDFGSSSGSDSPRHPLSASRGLSDSAELSGDEAPRRSALLPNRPRGSFRLASFGSAVHPQLAGKKGALREPGEPGARDGGAKGGVFSLLSGGKEASAGAKEATADAFVGEAPANPALPTTCGRNAWACRLGFCRQCAAASSAAEAAARLAEERRAAAKAAGGAGPPGRAAPPLRGAASPPAAPAAPPRPPRVRLVLTVQGGIDLTHRRGTRGHARVPSHEAILQVARTHRLQPPSGFGFGSSGGAGTVGGGFTSTLDLAGPFATPAPPLGSLPEREPWQDAADGDLWAGEAAPASPPARGLGQGVTPATAFEASAVDGGGARARAPPAGSGGGGPGPGRPALAGRGAVPRAASAPPSREDGRATRGEGEGDDEARGLTAVASSPSLVAPAPSLPETWEERKRRLRASSPFGHRAGWNLRACVVKSGDDCRQELLAMQFIRAFHAIFEEAGLPLWLRPYDVLVTGAKTALIELVPDAPSIHALKARGPRGMSLRDHFLARHGGGDGSGLERAQRAFAESMAAYSIVTYILAIRDRHNGNILLDDEGHVVHIDFGFMLSNSPGGVAFESAPFKLTRELLEVMDSDPDGSPSVPFDYFKVLLLRGFLAVRKHAERITLLAEMMASSGAPCFKARAAALDGIRRRFHLALPEHKLVDLVLGLVDESLDAWRTRQYDYYQRILNGIL